MGSNMREVDVVGIRFEEPEYAPVLILHEKEGGRYVPIWIGAAEAAAISLQQQGVQGPSPRQQEHQRDSQHPPDSFAYHVRPSLS